MYSYSSLGLEPGLEITGAADINGVSELYGGDIFM